MLNEKQIRNNIECKWVGEMDAIQTLFIKAGANGGKITQEEIADYQAYRLQGMKDQRKLWDLQDKKREK